MINGAICGGLNRTTSADCVSLSRRKKHILLAILVLHNSEMTGGAFPQDIVLVSAGCLPLRVRVACHSLGRS
jgi:hypothetical protein